MNYDEDDFELIPTEEDLSDDGGGEPLPKGRYSAIVSEAKMKPNKAGDGKYLELELTIQGPTHKGRKVWTRENLVNKNEQAVKIARQRVTSLVLAVGQTTFKASRAQELCNKLFEVNIDIEKGSGEHRDKNRVVSFVKPAGAKTAAPAGAGGAAQPAQKPGPPRVSEGGSGRSKEWQP